MSLKTKINKYIRKFGFEIHGLGYLQSLAKGDFKSNELQILSNLYGDEKLIIYDVGANIGLKVEEFLIAFPDSKIHAFEPIPDCFKGLEKKFSENDSVVLNNIGISNEISVKQFNINAGIGTSSFLESKKTGLNSDNQVKTLQKVELPLTTLDYYAKMNSHFKINLLKLDIQGSELNALKGAEQLLKQKKIDFIFCETYFIQQYEAQPLFYDISNYLITLDYVLQDVYHPIYGNGKIAWCDSLFVRNDFCFK